MKNKEIFNTLNINDHIFILQQMPEKAVFPVYLCNNCSLYIFIDMRAEEGRSLFDMNEMLWIQSSKIIYCNDYIVKNIIE